MTFTLETGYMVPCISPLGVVPHTKRILDSRLHGNVGICNISTFYETIIIASPVLMPQTYLNVMNRTQTGETTFNDRGVGVSRPLL
jgi:hypothetical protein